MSEMGRSRSLREYRDQLRDTLGRLEAEMNALEHAERTAELVTHYHALGRAIDAKQDEINDTLARLDTIESELATRAAGSGHLPE